MNPEVKLDPPELDPPDQPKPSTEPDPGRWIALVVIAIAQLMVVLDASIVNIALPQAQKDLGISDVDRQWVITAYTLAFGGLLLLGGRVATMSGASGPSSSGWPVLPLPPRWAESPRTPNCCSRPGPCRVSSPPCSPRRRCP